MHLQRPGVILVRILEFDTNSDVPRLKEGGFEKQEYIFFYFLEAIQKRLSSARGRQNDRKDCAVVGGLGWVG